MDTTIRSNDWDLPSGLEVESAGFVVVPEGSVENAPAARGGVRGKLDHWKSRGVETLDTLKSRSTDTMQSLQQRGLAMKSLVRDNVNERVAKVNESMRSSPMKWAGIAAGSGFALGLFGRFLHVRSHHRHHHHDAQLVIIDAC
jgi:ElaB/YqjD/DUF883 family membrane-anchored ribosome-binding protein